MLLAVWVKGVKAGHWVLEAGMHNADFPSPDALVGSHPGLWDPSLAFRAVWDLSMHLDSSDSSDEGF